VTKITVLWQCCPHPHLANL